MGVTTALVGSVGSGSGVISTQGYSNTMIRILVFSLVVCLALGLPQLSGRTGAAASPRQADALSPLAGSDHHVVRRSPEEDIAEPEPEAGDEAEGEPEPESESSD